MSPEITTRLNSREIRVLVANGLGRFEAAESPEEQLLTAAALLGACQALVERVDVNQNDSKTLGRFQRLLHERNISLNDVETFRREIAGR